jgi:hypothetical protein
MLEAAWWGFVGGVALLVGAGIGLWVFGLWACVTEVLTVLGFSLAFLLSSTG